MNKNNLLGIAGARSVSVEIKIPSGPNCLKCKARQNFFQLDFCVLYGARLSGHSRRAGRVPFGGSKEVLVVEKCEACLNGSQEYILTGKKK